MGVPEFFRWLMIRYPKILRDAYDPEDDDGTKEEEMTNLDNIPKDGIEIDNLYLDMNGIIHPCCHPEEGDQPTTEEEMFNNVFHYVDKLMRIVNPKKLLFMSVDGVAPRAKMNQQRSRRFKAAIELRNKQEKEEALKEEWRQNGKHIPENILRKSTYFDSNVITPGTPFMHKLSKALNAYIYERENHDERWKFITVIFSDSNVPGEGEHKILEYIRLQRTYPTFNPQTTHCIYGADADLIMLALSIHEPSTYIIRETIIRSDEKLCDKCHQKGHFSFECKGDGSANKISKRVKFQFLKISVLREYLDLEMNDIKDKLKMPYSLERIIDDFVFFCFFVGNDFLPKLPSLQIREGSIDLLLILYKQNLPKSEGYITDNGIINWRRVKRMLYKINKAEPEIFKQRFIANERNKNSHFNANAKFNINDKIDETSNIDNPSKYEPRNLLPFTSEQEIEEIKATIEEKNSQINILKQTYGIKIRDSKNNTEKSNLQCERNNKINEINDDVQNLQSKLDKNLNTKSLTKEEIEKKDIENFMSELKKKIENENDEFSKSYIDSIQLGSREGWRERYYFEKFNIRKEEIKDFTKIISQKYMEGLTWVLAYYYSGCLSWDWYYPFHYSPFASDLLNYEKNASFIFMKGEPHQPFEQLMSVLPPSSGHALPHKLKSIILNENSEIADFYPKTFASDMNGNRYSWMAVNLIPFIDFKRLREAINNCSGEYNQEELDRNSFGANLLFLNSESIFDKNISEQFNSSSIENPTNQFELGKINYLNISGFINHNPNQVKIGEDFVSPLQNLSLKKISNNKVNSYIYNYPNHNKHINTLLSNAKIPRSEVSNEEILNMDRMRGYGGFKAISIMKFISGNQKTKNYTDPKLLIAKKPVEGPFSKSKISCFQMSGQSENQEEINLFGDSNLNPLSNPLTNPSSNDKLISNFKRNESEQANDQPKPEVLTSENMLHLINKINSIKSKKINTKIKKKGRVKRK